MSKHHRCELSLLAARVEHWIGAFVSALHLAAVGFAGVTPAGTERPS